MTGAKLMQRTGVAGALGATLLISAAWMHWNWLPRQQAQVDEWGSQARRMRHELQARQEGQAASQVQTISIPDQAWQLVWQTLPDAQQRVDLQARVLDQARANGLNISAVQYQGARQPWAAQGGAVLWRQRMVMPVDGPYGAVRTWLAQMLKEPALSIDSLDLQRSDVMSEQVKARVSVSLWWRRQEDQAKGQAKAQEMAQEKGQP